MFGSSGRIGQAVSEPKTPDLILLHRCFMGSDILRIYIVQTVQYSTNFDPVSPLLNQNKLGQGCIVHGTTKWPVTKLDDLYPPMEGYR